MSEEPDESQKTEEPSEKKLADARRKGDVPTSREVATAASIAAAAILVSFAAPPIARKFIAAAGPSMFGVDSFEEIPNLKDMESIFEGPKYAKWNSFRESVFCRK